MECKTLTQSIPHVRLIDMAHDTFSVTAEFLVHCMCIYLQVALSSSLAGLSQFLYAKFDLTLYVPVGFLVHYFLCILTICRLSCPILTLD